MKTKPHKYTIIVKIATLANGVADCKKYRTSDKKKFTQFIEEKFGGWVWMKIFSNNGPNKKQLLEFVINPGLQKNFLYTIITKVGEEQGNPVCKKHASSDLINYVDFLEKNFPNWIWFKVYDSISRIQTGYFTRKKLPSARVI